MTLYEFLSRESGQSIAGIRPESSLKEDLYLDSLDLIELVMELEDKYDLDILDADAERWSTVRDIEDYLRLRGKHG